MPLAYIGLGSNLQNPQQQIEQALEELAEISDTQYISCSRFYQSQAIGPSQPDFINAVALIDTELTPMKLLEELQRIEQLHQRTREIYWGPRTLDLDLLLYGQDKIDLPKLKVPHPFLTRRAFVLYPLLDLNSNLILPDGRAVQDLLSNCTNQVLTPISRTKQ